MTHTWRSLVTAARNPHPQRRPLCPIVVCKRHYLCCAMLSCTVYCIALEHIASHCIRRLYPLYNIWTSASILSLCTIKSSRAELNKVKRTTESVGYTHCRAMRICDILYHVPLVWIIDVLYFILSLSLSFFLLRDCQVAWPETVVPKLNFGYPDFFLVFCLRFCEEGEGGFRNEVKKSLTVHPFDGRRASFVWLIYYLMLHCKTQSKRCITLIGIPTLYHFCSVQSTSSCAT